MAKTRTQKIDTVNVLSEKLQSAKSIVLTSQRGLTVKDSSDLRKKCRTEKIEYCAIKKTLLGIALEKAGILGVDLSSYDGIVGVVMSYDDVVAGARIAHKFSKSNDNLQLHAGAIDGVGVDSAKILQLALLPSKMELLAKLVGSMNYPISGFVGVLSGTMRGFVRVLDQIREAKQA